MAASYRTADQPTIRDFSARNTYVKTIGVVALLNTSPFTDGEVPGRFMAAFLDRMAADADNAVLAVPGNPAAPSFLWSPPRLANADLDVFSLAAQARQEGMNAVVSPILMDVRVRTRDTGFWIFKDVAYSLQIQTAASIYDAITGARLALGILIDEIDIDVYEAEMVRSGQVVEFPDLAETAAAMGEALGERMIEAANDSLWTTSVVALTNDACVLPVGGEAGIAEGDRFTVLDGSGMLTGLDGQRYIVPGPKTGDVVIGQVAPRRSLARPESGPLPPQGSILVPDG